MVTTNKKILLIIFFGVYLEQNRLSVLCDNWILKFKDDFSHNKIDEGNWYIYDYSSGKTIEVCKTFLNRYVKLLYSTKSNEHFKEMTN